MSSVQNFAFLGSLGLMDYKQNQKSSLYSNIVLFLLHQIKRRIIFYK